MMNMFKEIWITYNRLWGLSKINGPNVDKKLLDQVMFSTETLPPLGKEYWWFLAFDTMGDKPKQLMLLIFRKYGKKMLFNGETMEFCGNGKDQFRAVTSGWVYDGDRLLDLGDTNAIINVDINEIGGEVSGRKLLISGGYPNYKISVGDIIKLDLTKSDTLQEKYAHGVFLPPLGMGWVDAFGVVEGEVFGKKFVGHSHLQKVFGVTPFGPFHWGRIIFQNGSIVTFFCLKTGENSQVLFHKSLSFIDNDNNEIIIFDKVKLRISKIIGAKLYWVIEGKDSEKELSMMLESHAEKTYSMKGGGSQTYTEHAVTPAAFYLKTDSKLIFLDHLGKGWGTLEDAYW